MFYEVFYGHGGAGTLGDTLEGLLAEGFYKSVELGVVTEPGVQRLLRRKHGAEGLRVVAWLSSLGQREPLCFCALEEDRRARSVELALQSLPHIAEAGGTGVGISSGADPGPGLREEARKRLLESFYTVGRRAASLGISLLLEPLDRVANKRNLLGPTPETLAMIYALRQAGVPVAFAWDAAHAALNGEDVEQSLESALPVLGQIHLSNAVTDPQDARYGDNHMAFGSGGFLTADCATRLLARAHSERLEGGRAYAAMEVRCPPGGDPFRLERECRAFLEGAMAAAARQSIDGTAGRER